MASLAEWNSVDEEMLDDLGDSKNSSMRLWKNWKPYMLTFERGKAAMRTEHANLMSPRNLRPVHQMYDEMRALLQCFAKVYFEVDIEVEVLTSLVGRRLYNFNQFYSEVEHIIASKVALADRKRIKALEEEVATERALRKKAEEKAELATKRAGQVAAAVLEMADNEFEAELDLATGAQLVRIHHFADFN
ncbi:hypothetical protein CC79DRAFT_1327633 [Sarocladium strictum]